jgi:hypothetical protein
MFGTWTPFVALAAAILPLLWIKRWITFHLQELGMRWVGDPDVTLILYFVIVLPGVVVHELSHWLMAKVLGVRVSRLSIGPKRKGRSHMVSLGSVQVGKVDPLRASLIGLAPLLGGTTAVLLIGYLALDVGQLAEVMTSGGMEGVLAGLEQAVYVPDFWLWLYLIFAISNVMLPSYSDMATVRPVLIFLAIIAIVLLVVWGIPTIPPEVVNAATTVAGYLAMAFALTLIVDVVFMFLIGTSVWITRRIQD